MGHLHRFFRDRAAVLSTELRLLRRFGRVPPPTAVQWLATAACDLACPHCYTNAGKRHQDELTLEEAEQHLLAELIPLGRPTLVLAGGEAPLRKDFEAIVTSAAGMRIPWALHTHGAHVLRAEAVFTRHPPVMVAVSVDGPRELHDRFRGRAGSFDDAVAAIRFLVSSGVPEVVAGMTITRENADRIPEVLSTVIDSGAHGLGLHLLTPEGRGDAIRHLVPSPGQLRRVAALARRLRGFMCVELDNEWGSAGALDPLYRDDAFVCGAGRWSCVVTPTGDVMPCTTLDPSESQGNIRTRRLSEIWAGGFAAFRTEQDPLRGACDDCWLQTRHGNSCRASALEDLLPVETPREVAV